MVGVVRDPKSASADSLRALPAAEGSKVIVVKVEATSTTDAFDAVKELKAQGITKLDVVIASAAIAGQQGAMHTIKPENIAEPYLINAVGPAILFLAVKPLLDEAKTPKWLSVSTAGASLTDLEKYLAFVGYPYMASKTAMNFFTKSMHAEYPHIIAFVVSPG